MTVPPVGVPAHEAGVVTVAVNVTGCPYTGELVEAAREVAVEGTAGVTGAEGPDATLLPAEFAAVTVKEYVVPFVRPSNVVDVVAAPTETVCPPGAAVTV